MRLALVSMRLVMANPQLSLTEAAVLGLLGEGANHGFALARELSAEADLGRVLTVRRPLVYRALDRLVSNGLAAPVSEERGESGPNRIVHSITSRGRSVLGRWLEEPVTHVRDLRIEFLLKLSFLERSGRSPRSLLASQRTALAPTLAALEEPGSGDHIDLWRSHTAAAVAGYLDALLDRDG